MFAVWNWVVGIYAAGPRFSMARHHFFLASIDPADGLVSKRLPPYLQNQMKRILSLDSIRRSLALSRAVKALSVVLLSYCGGLYFTGLIHPESALFGAMWASVSGLASMQDDLPGTRDAAALRVWGTLVGAVIAATYLSLLPFSTLGLALAAGLAAGAGALLKLTDGGRLSAITVTVIAILTVINPDLHPVSNASLRFLESCLGSAMALLIALAWAGAGRLRRRKSVAP